ncbi:DsbC family protein [Massilia sp.]|uniref:DsbC family protein n=1 Tax=Massilia sp. TaxID=1882437 RepID=UPI00352D045F
MRALILAISLACCASARADFVQDLHAKYSQTKDAVVKKAFGNFYSVVHGNDVVYINEDLTILINGDVVDLKANRSLTSALREANRPKFDPTDLRESDAIKMGSGPRRIFVFSDPDCPFCRQLQAELGKLQNVSVYVLPLPLTGLHPNAATVAESIWCAADRSTAWNGYLLRGLKPADKACSNPLERNAALAAKYRVLGTPAIVFEDGSVIPGAVSAASIEARLASLAKK